MMAHEIAHVALAAWHEPGSKANLIQLPAMLAGAVVGNGSMLGQLAQLGIGLGANSVLLKYSRDAESDADILGARMMAKAGYNPIEMARFFEKLEAQGGPRRPAVSVRLTRIPAIVCRRSRRKFSICRARTIRLEITDSCRTSNRDSELCRQRRRTTRQIVARSVRGSPPVRAECASIAAALSRLTILKIGKHSGIIRARW